MWKSQIIRNQNNIVKFLNTLNEHGISPVHIKVTENCVYYYSRDVIEYEQ